MVPLWSSMDRGCAFAATPADDAEPVEEPRTCGARTHRPQNKHTHTNFYTRHLKSSKCFSSHTQKITNTHLYPGEGG